MHTTTHRTGEIPSISPDHRKQARLVRDALAAEARGDHDTAAQFWAAHEAWQEEAAAHIGEPLETCEHYSEVPPVRIVLAPTHARTTPRIARATRSTRTTTSRRTAAHSRRAKATSATSTGDGEPSEPSSSLAAPEVTVEPHAAPEGVTA